MIRSPYFTPQQPHSLSNERYDYIILGAGMAGLTAATELQQRQQRVALIEKSPQLGGLARTVVHEKFRFDLGGHRFHSYNPTLIHWLQQLLGDDLLICARQSHIFMNGRFIPYPLQFPHVLTAFPPHKAAHIAASYLRAQISRQQRPDHSFADWIINRFGRRMYETFFQPYTEKVWGIPGEKIAAEWAAQRIGLPNMWQAFKSALHPAAQPPATTISHFYYPRFGFGQIPQALHTRFRNQKGTLFTGATLLHLHPYPHHFELTLRLSNGQIEHLQTAELISTIPISALLNYFATPQHPIPPYNLQYRGLICLFLVLNKAQISNDHWTYFPDKKIIFGRTHEPKNWSPQMVPSAQQTSLCVEIFADPHDPIWAQPNSEIIHQVTAQFAQLGWFAANEVEKGWVVRLPHAYPVYRLGYRDQLQQAKSYLAQWPHLHLIGRTGSFRYMNSDGVIEDVFRFLQARFPNSGHMAETAVLPNGRWV